MGRPMYGMNRSIHQSLGSEIAILMQIHISSDGERAQTERNEGQRRAVKGSEGPPILKTMSRIMLTQIEFQFWRTEPLDGSDGSRFATDLY